MRKVPAGTVTRSGSIEFPCNLAGVTDAADASRGPDPGVALLLREIRSQRTFLSEPVTQQEMTLLLEAARWAPSTWNTQPWRFVVVRPIHGSFDAVVDSLTASNRRWAAHAPVLIVVAACVVFDDGHRNRHALHDVGIASAFMAVQAVAGGLHVQSMAGFSPDAARLAVGVPSDHEIVTILAVGRVEALGASARRNGGPDGSRTRRPMAEIARDEVWDRPYSPDR
jgi:nitroreductase